MDSRKQSSQSLGEELQRLADLRQQGLLTEDEFHEAKKRLLSPGSSTGEDVQSESTKLAASPTATSSIIKYVVPGVVVLALVGAGIAYTSMKASPEPVAIPAPAAQTQSTSPPPEPVTQKEEPAAEPRRHTFPKTVEAPAINVGDKYTYETESTDSDGKTTTATSTREVTAIDGDRVTVTVTSGKTGKARTLIYDRSWNLLETGDTPTAGLIYKPAIQYFDFPLTVGKKWKSLAEDTDKKTGKSRQYVINAEVWGWDEIVVGAGTFDALKIIISSNVIDGEKRSTGTDVSWYAPSIGRTVKSELSGEDAGGRIETKTIVLVSNSNSAVASREPMLSNESGPQDFQCPESLQTQDERIEDLAKFLKWAKSQHPDWTTDQIIALRVSVLKQHHCDKTIANIKQAEEKARTPSPEQLCKPYTSAYFKGGWISGAGGNGFVNPVTSLESILSKPENEQYLIAKNNPLVVRFGNRGGGDGCTGIAYFDPRRVRIAEPQGGGKIRGGKFLVVTTELKTQRGLNASCFIVVQSSDVECN